MQVRPCAYLADDPDADAESWARQLICHMAAHLVEPAKYKQKGQGSEAVKFLAVVLAVTAGLHSHQDGGLHGTDICRRRGKTEGLVKQGTGWITLAKPLPT